VAEKVVNFFVPGSDW